MEPAKFLHLPESEALTALKSLSAAQTRCAEAMEAITELLQRQVVGLGMINGRIERLEKERHGE